MVIVGTIHVPINIWLIPIKTIGMGLDYPWINIIKSPEYEKENDFKGRDPDPIRLSVIA